MVLRQSATTRTRSWVSHTSAFWDQADFYQSSRTVYTGRQRTTSEGHFWPPPKDSSFLDQGGPFRTDKVYHTDFHPLGYYTMRYGPTARPTTEGAVPSSMPSSLAYLPVTPGTQLVAEGAKALAAMRPTAPLSGFGTSLGELVSDGLPSAVGAGLLKSLISDHRRRRSTLQAGSDEFLNWEFGWKPLVSDLQDAARAVSKSEQIITQLYRDSGRDVRRRFRYPIEESVTSDLVQPDWPNFVLAPFSSSASATRIETRVTREIWVSGMCRYYVPQQDDLLSRIRRYATVANRLLGVRPDPEFLWELAPWSWLVDWVSDVGSLMGNLSSYAFDGLVWKYAYLMEHRQERRRYRTVGLTMFDGSTPLCEATTVRESKQRIAATPFGFGLSLDSFTERQWAILAALGVSRGHFNRP